MITHEDALLTSNSRRGFFLLSLIIIIIIIIICFMIYIYRGYFCVDLMFFLVKDPKNTPSI